MQLLAEEVALVTYRTVRIDTKTGERTGALRSSVWTRVNGSSGECGFIRELAHSGCSALAPTTPRGG